MTRSFPTEQSVDLKFTNGTSSSNNAGLLLRVGEYGGGADNFDGYEVSLFADGKRLLLGKHLHNWQELKTTPVDVIRRNGTVWK